MCVDIVGDDYSAWCDVIFDSLEIGDVFVFCGIEKCHVESAWRFGDCFGGVAENKGGEFGKSGFFEISCSKVVTLFFVGLDCVEVAAVMRKRFGHPNAGIADAGADFEDVFRLSCANKQIEKLTGFRRDTPVFCAEFSQ